MTYDKWMCNPCNLAGLFWQHRLRWYAQLHECANKEVYHHLIHLAEMQPPTHF